MLVDLHTHSTFSDGRYTPTQLVEEAVAKGIVALALADHDSWNGVEEAKQAADAARCAYQKNWGPLTLSAAGGEDCFDWNKSPLPWEWEAN